jgi:hypothetical protein
VKRSTSDECGPVSLLAWLQKHWSQASSWPCVDTKNCPFCEVIQMWNGLHHCIPLVETVKKTYMKCLIRSPDEGAMPLERCSVVGTSDGRDF